MSHVRKTPEVRKQAMIEAGLAQAIKGGIASVTRVSIAQDTGVSVGLVSRYFGTIDELRSQVGNVAIWDRHEKLVAECFNKGLIAMPAGPRDFVRAVKRELAAM